jgi:hypothetical protein
MDDVQNRLARELADAVAAAVAGSSDVERCRDRARAEGFQLRITLEATVGFAPVTAADGDPAQDAGETDPPPPAAGAFEISANDRRFLRSLRIAADEAPVEEAN